eukprot:TRINITY_DN54591_c0_g1_i1.p1 TRINITY_DN54591_c0_g1~~TRINITY_DN54591_c0_g1_i1.p1  ORF type:complete len:281 (+),score=39.73 TRINITY_DN54591_c0_g1_i1:122-844(+)
MHAAMNEKIAMMRMELSEARAAVLGYRGDCEELRECIPELMECVTDLQSRCASRQEAIVYERLEQMRMSCELDEETALPEFVSTPSICSLELRMQLQQAEDRQRQGVEHLDAARRRIASLVRRRDELREEVVDMTASTTASLDSELHSGASALSQLSSQLSQGSRDVDLPVGYCCLHSVENVSEGTSVGHLRLELERSEVNTQTAHVDASAEALRAASKGEIRRTRSAQRTAIAARRRAR